MTSNTPPSQAKEGQPAAAAPTLPTREELLSLVDHEIEAVQAEQARSGWTVQATLAALGAIAWVVLSEIASGYPGRTEFAAALIMCSCALDALVTLVRTLRAEFRSPEARFDWPGRVTAQRPWLVSGGLRDLLLGTVAYFWLPKDDVPLARWIAIVFFGVNGLISIQGVAMMPWVLPHMPAWPLHHTRVSRRLKLLIGTGGGALVIALLFGQVPWHDPHVVATTLKVGGGAAVLLMLAANLESHGPQTALVHVLADLRRKIALHQAPIADAAEAVDVVVRGLRVSHVLQRYIVRVLGRCSEAEALLSRLEQQLVGSVQTAPRASAKDKATHEVPPHAGRSLQRVDELIAQSTRRLQDLRAVAKSIAMYAPESSAESEPIIGNVAAGLANIVQARARVGEMVAAQEHRQSGESTTA